MSKLSTLLEQAKIVQQREIASAEQVSETVNPDTVDGARKNIRAWEIAHERIHEAREPALEYIEDEILGVLRHAEDAEEIVQEIRDNPGIYAPLVQVVEDHMEDDAVSREEHLTPASFRDGLAAASLRKLEPVYIYRRDKYHPGWWVSGSLARTEAWGEYTGGGGYSKAD